MGIPGMGGGPYGGGRRGRSGNESEEDRQKMEDVVNPAQALTVAEGKKEHLKTLRSCQDCAALCSTSAQIVSRAGPFSAP